MKKVVHSREIWIIFHAMSRALQIAKSASILVPDSLLKQGLHDEIVLLSKFINRLISFICRTASGLSFHFHVTSASRTSDPSYPAHSVALTGF